MSPQDIGAAAISQVFKLWQVDEKWSIRESRGFTWWAGDFRQRIYVDEGRPDRDVRLYRLSAETDFSRGIDPNAPDIARGLAALNRYSSAYALCLFGPERRIRLCSSVVFHQETASWVVKHFSALAIIQVIDAQIRAKTLSTVLGGAPDESCHPHYGVRASHDDMLNLVEALYGPEGAKSSRWEGSGEFEQAAEFLEQCDLFANAGPIDLTAEVAFGDDTALINMTSREPHPQLGHGILFTLKLPFVLSEMTAAHMALDLNGAEMALTFSHLLGAWTYSEVGEAHVLTFVGFIPNALYRPRLLTNIAISLMTKARWARNEMAPYLEDEDLERTLRRRFGIR